MKKTLLFISLLILSVLSTQATRPKYVFYIIGDGMGINQVNGTEMFYGELTGKIGPLPLLFSKFPYTTFVSTYSANRGVTDSAAAGTALACGEKTNNNTIGVDADSLPIYSIAVAAQKKNIPVGIITSGEIDDATPAAFYAHQADRNMNYEIAIDLTKANFDFYAGGGFLKPDKTHDRKDAPNIFPIFEEAGYTVARGYNDYKAKSKDAGKMILIQEEGKDPSCLPYAIDRKSDDLTLAQITESAIDFLTKGKNKGFFLMVEGGKIDWACHANDAATVFNEVKDMDDAIKVAYEFYKKHPKETLIVVTADHETGGIVLGTGRYELNLKALQYQKHSADGLSKQISELRKSKGNKVTWEDMKEFLGNEMGFWKQFPISWEQEKKLRDEFEQSFVRNKVVFAESMYSKSEPMAARAKEVMDQISMVGWVSGGHSAGYVPVFAIGAGSQLFGEKIDNTEIPKRIAKAAGYK